jgi:oligosaccharide reducing-end xylanase
MQNEAVKRGLALAGFVEGTKSPSLTAGQPVYEAYYNVTGIVVDGLLDDWVADESRIRLGKEHLDYGTVSKPGDAGADIALAWNETYLYISANVEDEEIVAKRTVRYSHKDDLLELFIDLDGDGFTWKSPKDPQYGFSFDPKHKTPRLFDWGTEKEIPLGKDTLLAMELTQRGYVIEAALPWMALDIVPSNPLELAITPALHDLDTGNEAKLTWYFKDRGSEKGIALGKVRLKKS